MAPLYDNVPVTQSTKQTQHVSSADNRERSPNGIAIPAPGYTQGNSIHVDTGQKRQVPHEAWHVIQQKKTQVTPSNVIQRLSMEDRNWNELTSVRNLSKGAYLATSPSGSLVIKIHGDANIKPDLGSAESPLAESLGAKLGEIASFGIKTAGTVLIETAGVEGKQIILKLKSLGGKAAELAAILENGEAFLVMEHVQGEPFSKFKDIRPKLDRNQLAKTYREIGRLWTFDVVINNTDRFAPINMGNFIVGPNGGVTGIDQNVFMAATDFGLTQIGEEPENTLAKEHVGSALADVLTPDKRRRFSLNMFRKLKDGGMPDRDQALFVLCFEMGILDGIVSAANTDPLALREKVSELPDTAVIAAQELGLGGAEIILKAMRDVAGEAGDQIPGLSHELKQREKDRVKMNISLKPLNDIRMDVLKKLFSETDALYKKSLDVNTWMFSKDSFWKGQTSHLEGLGMYNQEAYFQKRNEIAKAIADNKRKELFKEQISIWTNKLLSIWSSIAVINKDYKDTKEVSARLLELRNDIVQEHNSPKLTEMIGEI